MLEIGPPSRRTGSLVEGRDGGYNTSANCGRAAIILAGERRFDMQRVTLTALAFVAALLAAAPCNADSSNTTAGSFNSGIQQIGAGAEKIGEGIKKGAIQTWEALKAGASAAAAKFNGAGASSTKSPPPRSAGAAH
jgi:hypothetical protein